MHEQSIVESLLALAIKNAEKEKAHKILRIYLVVGELSGVVEESVDFYFSLLSKDTIAADASLFFMHVAAQLRCRNCNIIFSPKSFNFHCPKLYIDSMEVE
jgi:hydrogenase nickel incorporation protein HypA/HybF